MSPINSTPPSRPGSGVESSRNKRRICVYMMVFCRYYVWYSHIFWGKPRWKIDPSPIWYNLQLFRSPPLTVRCANPETGQRDIRWHWSQNRNGAPVVGISRLSRIWYKTGTAARTKSTTPFNQYIACIHIPEFNLSIHDFSNVGHSCTEIVGFKYVQISPLMATTHVGKSSERVMVLVLKALRFLNIHPTKRLIRFITSWHVQSYNTKQNNKELDSLLYLECTDLSGWPYFNCK